ncbi:MAG: glycosyltransferase [Chitinophagaceae bacterium]|nr:glycosyltransferase [Chitinophagaceae bacterium]
MQKELAVKRTDPSLLPAITIITPSYNQGRFIEETILSVIDQGYPRLEYIIMDGGSTDETVEVIKKYADRIHYWVSEKDNGQSHAINKGLRMATGDIINWINSDDMLTPDSLWIIAQHFLDHPEAVMVHGRIEYFGQGKNYYSRNLPEKDLNTRYAAHICMPQPACFFKRKLVLEQGYLDESLHFSMDTDLFVRAGLHYPIVQVEEVLAKFRLHGDSKSVSAFSKTFLDDNKKIFSRVLATLGAEKEIAEMKSLQLYEEPAYLYHKPAKAFDTGKMLFYFLAHRLLTLHFRGDKQEYKKIFGYLLKKHTGLLISSGKLVLYRLALFFPRGFFHSLAKLRDRAG